MGVVQYFLTVLLTAQLLLAFPTQMEGTYMDSNRICQKCPAGPQAFLVPFIGCFHLVLWSLLTGKFAKSCNVCEPCREGTYTSVQNSEDSCFPCFRDCLPKYHLRVVQNCTRTTPLRCECEPGFTCVAKVSGLNNCRTCERVSDTTEPCRSPKCGLQPVPMIPTPDPDFGTSSDKEHRNAQLAAILCPLIFIGFVALVALFCIYNPRDETCFRQTIAKLCSEKGKEAPHTSKEATHQFPNNSSSAKQQTSSSSAANLGPVHVHNPGTVIFSLLSQFTGPVGPTILGGKRGERASNLEEDEKDCPVFHPAPSPSVPLSEEERSSEADNIFFPSQEQGKDYHMSKEEGL